MKQLALYLVTGGAGFIGSNIVEELLRRGESVRILDNFSNGKREKIAQIEGILKEESNSKYSAVIPKFISLIKIGQSQTWTSQNQKEKLNR